MAGASSPKSIGLRQQKGRERNDQPTPSSNQKQSVENGWREKARLHTPAIRCSGKHRRGIGTASQPALIPSGPLRNLPK